jgi:transposase InsO family protein
MVVQGCMRNYMHRAFIVLSLRVARLMREQGIFAKRPRHRTMTTKSEPGAQGAPNLLQRDFSADQPKSKWVADTTYIWTTEGWLYLAVVLDLFSRMVARLVYGNHPGRDPGRASSANGCGSSLSTGRVTPSLRSWKHLHERELASTLRARRHASEYEPHC